MTPLIWTRRAIEDVQSIHQFIAQDSPHYAQLVRQQLIAAVERLPAFPQSGRMVPEVNDPAIREVIKVPIGLSVDSFTARFTSLSFITQPGC